MSLRQRRGPRFRRPRRKSAFPLTQWVYASRVVDGVRKGVWLCSRHQGMAPEDSKVRIVKEDTARRSGALCLICGD